VPRALEFLLPRLRMAFRWVPIVVVVWIAVAAYVLLAHGGASDLVWDRADARHYKWLADSLLSGEFEKSSFQIGFPLLLAPFDLLSGTQHDRSLEAANALNPYSIVLLAGVVLPAAFCLIGATGAAILRDRRATVPIALGALALTFIYISLPPPYASGGDGHFQPLQMLGLVPAVEPLNLLYSALLCFAVARPRAIHPLALGAIIGFAAMVKETNPLLAAVFMVVYVVSTRDVFAGLRIAFAALVVYSVQLAYNAHVYGALLFPNRDRQWNDTRQAEGFGAFVEQRYDLTITKPPRISAEYLPLNLREALAYYAVPLLALLVASGWMAWRFKAARLFVAFGVASITAFGLFHLAYIRPGATFRYMQAIAPQAFLLVLVGLWASARHTLPWDQPRSVDTERDVTAGPAGPGRESGGRSVRRQVLVGAAVILVLVALLSRLDRQASAPAAVCEPQETEPLRNGRPIRVGESVTVDVSRDPRTPMRARITHLGVKRPSAVRDRFAGRGTFRPGPESTLVAVVFRFENVGSGTIEAGNSVHQFFVAEAQGKAWTRADSSPACPTVSPSFAEDLPGGASPEADVGPGDGYKTTVVYSMPKERASMTWVGPRDRFRGRELKSR
jgi:hypothetical protein